MTKNMFVVLITLVVLALGLALSFDGFRVLAVLGFMMALDMQIVMAYRAIKMQKLIEAMKNEDT